MIKYFNYIFFSLLITLFFNLDTIDKISTNLEEVLPSSEKKELFEEFLNLESNKKIFLVVKGTDKNSFKISRNIESQFLKIDGIKKQEILANPEFLAYQKKYQFYINELEYEEIQNIDVKNELQKLYLNIVNAFITIDINKYDPFGLIKKPESTMNIKNGKLLLGEYGYLTVFNIDKNKRSLQEYENIYDQIQVIEKRNSNIQTFSSIYFFVENSRYIKSDSSSIIVLASIILLILYLFFLRNINLLLNTLLTLASSALISTIILTFLYGKISLFVLVFGISVSTIAIDYMFHHYFHKSYERKSFFNKDVFLGFFTTFVSFLILSFVDFILIKQITQFTMISLFCSYIIFAFIYPLIVFKEIEFKFSINKFRFLNTKYIFIFSIIILLYSMMNLNFTFDIQSLNYDNKLLKKKEFFFKDQLIKEKHHPVMLKAKSIDELIYYNEQVKKKDEKLKSSLNSLISQKRFLLKQEEFRTLNFYHIKEDIDTFSSSLGFKKDFFNKAYNTDLEIPHYTYSTLQDFGVSIRKYKNEYISVVYVSDAKIDEVLKLNFVYSLSLKKIFEESLQEDLNKMLQLGLLSFLFILFILFLLGRENLLYVLNFLILPSAFIFFYLSFIEINILHIFMFFIILAISVDYAIYSSKKNSIATKKAIIFSAISSFAGFGVLVFSSSASLYSIGSVATIGISAILILILFEKVKNVS